jgi:molybdopterin/thiamine biosynthesis adenylyltransferase
VDPGVLIIGAGGLGCPAALALGAGGARRIGIVDDDRVDASNLHRQVLFTDADVGEPKAVAAARALSRRFRALDVVPHAVRFDVTTARELCAAYDVVIDGSDNFATKFLANDAAVLARRPLVHAAAVGMGGQLLTVPAGGRPCYRCLFEEPAARRDRPVLRGSGRPRARPGGARRPGRRRGGLAAARPSSCFRRAPAPV